MLLCTVVLVRVAGQAYQAQGKQQAPGCRVAEQHHGARYPDFGGGVHPGCRDTRDRVVVVDYAVMHQSRGPVGEFGVARSGAP